MTGRFLSETPEDALISWRRLNNSAAVDEAEAEDGGIDILGVVLLALALCTTLADSVFKGAVSCFFVFFCWGVFSKNRSKRPSRTTAGPPEH